MTEKLTQLAQLTLRYGCIDYNEVLRRIFTIDAAIRDIDPNSLVYRDYYHEQVDLFNMAELLNQEHNLGRIDHCIDFTADVSFKKNDGSVEERLNCLFIVPRVHKNVFDERYVEYVILNQLMTQNPGMARSAFTVKQDTKQSRHLDKNKD